MKKHILKRLNNGWRLKFGGTQGESFEIYLRYFTNKGFRLVINLNTDKLIKVFGFNQFILGI